MKTNLLLSTLGAITFVSFNVSAEIIYDNSSNYEGFFNDTRLEAGDQIELAGDERLLTEFSFEYFASFTATGDETARLRFYSNDGPYGENPFLTPGTLLYDSGAFDITSGYHTVTVEDITVLLASESLIWTVQFEGITESESAGLLYYDAPTVGTSGNFFWQKEAGAWSAVAVEGAGNNFGARATAIAAPAPLSIQSIQKTGATATVNTTAKPGKAYALEYKGSVDQAGWSRVSAAPERAGAATLSLEDPTAGQTRFRLYRVVEFDTTIQRTAGQAEIVSTAVAGREYALQGSADLLSWSNVEEQVASGNTVAFNPPTTGNHRFFRVIEPATP